MAKNKLLKKQNSRHERFDKKVSRVLHASSEKAYFDSLEKVQKIRGSRVTTLPRTDLEIHLTGCEELELYFEDLQQTTNEKPSCAKGCSGCCKYPIYATQVEFEAVRNWIHENFSEEDKMLLQVKLGSWREEIGELADNLYLGQEIRNQYIEANVKCPFLVNNECSIYPVRPITCRTYFSYGDPKDCEKELYPHGTASFTCARNNIYKVPIANILTKLANGDETKKRQKYSKFFFHEKLLAIWFLEDSNGMPALTED